MERNRTPLEELRQVAEDTLNQSNYGDNVSFQKTGCLGPCSEGHIMGIADESEGVYLFKQMNDGAIVKHLANVALQSVKSDSIPVTPELKSHLEAKLSPRSISEIPFEN